MSSHESRRDFFANLAVLTTVVPGMGWAGRYALEFLAPPPVRRVKEVLVGKLGGLPKGSSRLLKGVCGNDLILIRLPNGDVKGFSSVCTHLGCHVQWDPVAGNFLCPCHMGRFDTGGQVIAGPPPAPLPSYATRVEGDSVFVLVPVKET